MRQLTYLIVCILQIVACVRAAGKYTVIGPGTIHSGDRYTVSLAVHRTAEPSHFKVGITGPSYNETKEVTLSPEEGVKQVDFDLPPLETGDYNLTSEVVIDQEVLRNTTKLNYAKFQNHVRIQTDKGLYKPGDVLNFRVLFLDKDLKPVEPEQGTLVWVEDGKRNRIKEFKNLTVIKGVYTDRFQISEFPVMGSWRMGVSTGDRYDRQVYFEVEKYVLPKYMVEVEATERVSVKDGDMQVVVRANYTYGKPVDGSVTLRLSLGTVYHFDYHGSDDAEMRPQAEPPTIIRSAPMVNGKAKFNLNVKEYEPHLTSKTSASYLNVLATVEEQFTGVKINGSTGTTLYPYRYSMNCISYDTCSTFVAEEEKEVIFHITYVDGTELHDTKSPVEAIYTEVLSKNQWWHPILREGEEASTSAVTMEPPLSENRTFRFLSHQNETGFAIFKVRLPELKEYESYSHFYKLELSYRDEKRELYTTYQYREPKKIEPSPEELEKAKEYLKLEYRTRDDSLKLNKASQFTVNSSRPLPYFVYNVVGRGNILHSERINLPKNTKIFNFTLTPTFPMAPNFNIYLYYVDDSGEFRYAEQHYYVDVELQNSINVTGPDQVKPGADVPLTIKTAPNSLVGLMAVDQSVLLLRANNDIKQHDFHWALNSYGTNTPWQGGYSRYPGGSAGVVTLTNADYFYNRTKPDYSSSKRTTTSDAIPPMALGSASVAGAAGVGGGGGTGAQVAVRRDFSETWLFENIENTEAEQFTWIRKIPDTITKWVLSAFSIHPLKGLGILHDSTKITTFQPFFISVRLPYSVKRGEVINVPALVFNYLDKSLDVQVTLDNADGEFEFTDVTNEIIDEPKRVQTIHVPANGAAGVSFLLRPKVIGNVMLKYTAISPIAGDAVHKTMKVVPEGVTQYANRAYLVNLKNQRDSQLSFELEYPQDVVPDSQHAEVGVMGDLLGPVLNNLDDLVRLPTGCGEQITSTLLPNYLILEYLKDTGKLTATLQTRLLHNLETGYQRILAYRHNDGSFSSFGPSLMQEKNPRNGSTWLTAYVTRSLQQIGKYIDVDHKIVDGGLAYLTQLQAKNGSFVEKGDYFYAAHKNLVTLTSTVLSAFLQNETVLNDHCDLLDKAFSYVSDNFEKTEDLQAQALATYILNIAKHPRATEFLKRLVELARTDGDRKWWSPNLTKPSKDWWRWSYSSDVEITSYILLTLLDQPSTTVDQVLPTVTWLIANRNSFGGFSSTQDTVVGLQALIKFAKFSEFEAANMDITIRPPCCVEAQKTIQLNKENGLLYQTTELPVKTDLVEMKAAGSGAALVQIAYQYNILEKEPRPSFAISATKYNQTPPAQLKLDVCVEYTGDGAASNMAILEVSLPSGYEGDEDLVTSLQSVDGVSNVELRNTGSLVVVYFDHLYKGSPKCLLLEAFKTHAVAMQKPASIVLYDYYETARRATTFYEVESKLCDICEGEECEKCK